MCLLQLLKFIRFLNFAFRILEGRHKERMKKTDDESTTTMCEQKVIPVRIPCYYIPHVTWKYEICLRCSCAITCYFTVK